MISTNGFITLKIQYTELKFCSVCPRIIKKCAWGPNFSHFGKEMAKIIHCPKMNPRLYLALFMNYRKLAISTLT